jgi:hypothetical protein
LEKAKWIIHLASVFGLYPYSYPSFVPFLLSIERKGKIDKIMKDIYPNRKDTMSEIVNQSLQKIAKGTGIVFIGTIIGMLLGFIGRIILVRYITQTEYGIYCLALVIISIFATISTLGLQEGTQAVYSL